MSIAQGPSPGTGQEAAEPPQHSPGHDRGKVLVLTVSGFVPFGLLLFRDKDFAGLSADVLAISVSCWIGALVYLPRLRTSGRRVPARRLMLTAATALLMVGIGSLGYEFWQSRRGIDVAASLSAMVESREWGDGTVANITIAQPWRSRIQLTFLLENSQPQISDCVSPATLVATPIIDGTVESEFEVKARSGVPVDVSLQQPEKQLTLRVLLQYPKNGPLPCRVSMRITKAVLHD